MGGASDAVIRVLSLGNVAKVIPLQYQVNARIITIHSIKRVLFG